MRPSLPITSMNGPNVLAGDHPQQLEAGVEVVGLADAANPFGFAGADFGHAVPVLRELDRSLGGEGQSILIGDNVDRLEALHAKGISPGEIAVVRTLFDTQFRMLVQLENAKKRKESAS